MIAPDQRLPISSTALWNRAQSPGDPMRHIVAGIAGLDVCNIKKYSDRTYRKLITAYKELPDQGDDDEHSVQPATSPHHLDRSTRSHTNVEFAVRHLMITTVKGRFTDVSGHRCRWTRPIPPPRPPRSPSRWRASTRASRSATRTSSSADFFEVEKFPTLTFRSTGVRDVTADGFTLLGDLTIHGVTREVTLDVIHEGRARDPWGGERAGYARDHENQAQ